MTNDRNLVIVGASLAGSSLAYYLGSRGISVTLIDKDSFPRRKPCGEGLYAYGIEKLAQLGLSELVQSLPHTEFRHFRIWLKGRSVKIPSFGRAPSFGIARTRLDDTILNAAIRTGNVEFLPNTPVRAVSRSTSGYEVHYDQNAFLAPVVILAAGGQAAIAERLNLHAIRKSASRFGVTLPAQVSSKTNDVEVMLEKGFELFCTQVDETTLNIAVLGTKAKVGSITQEGLTPHLITKIERSLGLKILSLGKPLAIGPVNSARRTPPDENIILIGDSLEVFDPIGGMGMTHAFVCAERLGFHLLRHFKHGVPLPLCRTQYYLEREREAKKLRRLTSLAYTMLHRLNEVLLS